MRDPPAAEPEGQQKVVLSDLQAKVTSADKALTALKELIRTSEPMSWHAGAIKEHEDQLESVKKALVEATPIERRAYRKWFMATP